MQNHLEEIILSQKKLSVFTIEDFLSYASYEEVESTFRKLEEGGKIKQAIEGFFYIPEFCEFLQIEAEAPVLDVVKAIAKANKWEICPFGGYCRNAIGLDTQVPAKYIFVSDGPITEYRIYGTPVYFEHEDPRNLIGISMKYRMLVQAIKESGRELSRKDISILRRVLIKEDMEQIIKECKNVTPWVYEEIKKVQPESCT